MSKPNCGAEQTELMLVKNQIPYGPPRLSRREGVRAQGQLNETVLKISQYLIDEHRTEGEMLNYKRRIEN